MYTWNGAYVTAPLRFAPSLAGAKKAPDKRGLFLFSESLKDSSRGACALRFFFPENTPFFQKYS